MITNHLQIIKLKMITSPYNFVPLSEKVVMPFWAKYVSHDVPFKNGVSGVLKLKIKAESPIYVRNGVFYDDAQKKNQSEINSFNKFNNRYFIPSTSVSGMLRSVMEIMSFGRMANKVNDDRYSVRDFQNNDIYPIAQLSQTVSCGWLKKVDGEYLLQDCGEPGRISHEKLDEKFGTGMSAFFQKKENVRPNAKSAKFKYDKYPQIKGTHRFSGEKVVLRYICDFDESGSKGKIVLTGQPGHRFLNPKMNKWEGKHLEFVFFEKGTSFKPVAEDVIKNFYFAYYDHDLNQAKEDWKLLHKPTLEKGEMIPVFFRKEVTGNIKDMGLSYLYKITYEQSIVEAIQNSQKNADSHDLAETIFGYAEKEDALKGRIHIGHAFAAANMAHTHQPLSEKKEVLSGPKASYYPNYVAQDQRNGTVQKYMTFMNTSSTIKGWKRYPIRHDGIIRNAVTVDNEKVVTKFAPLDKGATFECAVHYHNLREEELGALLSAMTFHNTNDLFHSLGMGKPLGYGKITLSVEGLNDAKKVYYLKVYETYMDYALNHAANDWHKSPQIVELLTMAKGHAQADNQLKYMVLTDFVAAKGRRKTDPQYVLENFSAIAKTKVAVKSLTSASDLTTAKTDYQAEERAFGSSKDKEQLKNNVKMQYEEALKQRFEEKKAQLLAFLVEKQRAKKVEEIAFAEEERLRKKQNVAETALQTDLVFNSLEYEDIAKVLKTHFEKYKVPQLTETQKAQLAKQLVDSYNFIKNTNKPKKEKWLKNGNKFGEHPWTDIRKWLGEADSKVLHDLLIPK
jgi:CRISPR-associated protein (TIGR03986 family)